MMRFNLLFLVGLLGFARAQGAESLVALNQGLEALANVPQEVIGLERVFTSKDVGGTIITGSLVSPAAHACCIAVKTASGDEEVQFWSFNDNDQQWKKTRVQKSVVIPRYEDRPTFIFSVDGDSIICGKGNEQLKELTSYGAISGFEQEFKGVRAHCVDDYFAYRPSGLQPGLLYYAQKTGGKIEQWVREKDAAGFLVGWKLDATIQYASMTTEKQDQDGHWLLIAIEKLWLQGNDVYAFVSEYYDHGMYWNRILSRVVRWHNGMQEEVALSSRSTSPTFYKSPALDVSIDFVQPSWDGKFIAYKPRHSKLSGWISGSFKAVFIQDLSKVYGDKVPPYVVDVMDEPRYCSWTFHGNGFVVGKSDRLIFCFSKEDDGNYTIGHRLYSMPIAPKSYLHASLNNDGTLVGILNEVASSGADKKELFFEIKKVANIPVK